MFGTNIRKVAIMMVDRDANYKDFVIEDEEFDKYANKWAQRLADYYEKQQ
jgi:hypothetical protein